MTDFLPEGYAPNNAMQPNERGYAERITGDGFGYYAHGGSISSVTRKVRGGKGYVEIDGRQGAVTRAGIELSQQMGVDIRFQCRNEEGLGALCRCELRTNDLDAVAQRLAAMNHEENHGRGKGTVQVLVFPEEAAAFIRQQEQVQDALACQIEAIGGNMYLNRAHYAQAANLGAGEDAEPLSTMSIVNFGHKIEKRAHELAAQLMGNANDPMIAMLCEGMVEALVILEGRADRIRRGQPVPRAITPDEAARVGLVMQEENALLHKVLGSRSRAIA